MYYKKNCIQKIIIIFIIVVTHLIFNFALLYASRRILFERERIITIEYPDVEEEKTVTKTFPKAEGKVTLQFYAESEEIVRGHNIDLKLVLSWNGNKDLYSIISPNLKLQNLTLQNISKSAITEEQEEGTLQKKIITYRLKGIDIGEGVIESFRCHFYRKGSPSPYTITIPKSILPIVEMRWDIQTSAIVFALVFGGILMIIMIVSRDIAGAKKEPRDEKKSTINIKIDQIREQLDALKPVIAQGDAKTFFIKLSLLLSNYLTKEYSLGAEQNIINDIDVLKDVSRSDKLMLKNVFQLCEKVQFAGYECERGEIEAIYKKVITFIEGKRII